MAQQAFCVDLGKCIGCNACVIACKQWRELPDAIARRVVYDLPEKLVESPLRNYLSVSCNHCDNPGCMSGCPAGAYTKNDQGIVVHNPDVCVGCKLCEWTCPYNVPTFDETAGVMNKCDMCVGRTDNPGQPACAEFCPVDAIQVYNVEQIPEGYQRGVDGYPDVNLTGANIYVKLPDVVKQYTI